MAAKIRIIDGSKFNWRKGKGSTFASDLQISEWPGSFYIMSHRTGQQKLFLRGEEIRSNDEDRELQGVEYFVPGGHTMVTIWNT